MMTLLSRPLLAASLILVLVSTAAGAATHVHASPQLKTLHGSATQLHGATRLSAAPSTAPVDVVVSLEPRHADLLHAYASQSGTQLSNGQLHSMFAPSAASRAAVMRYMRAQGFALRSSGLLSMSFHGSSAAAGRAFHVGMSSYRGANGKHFRAPDGAIRLPAGIASVVSDVSGLNTALTLQNHTKLAKSVTALAPHGVATCAGATNAKSFYGGYLPQDLQTAYTHGTLIAGGNNGSNQTIALAEFSSYKSDDINSFKSCFGLTQPVHNHAVNAGTSSLGGAIEVELDIEVALSQAPDLDSVEVYKAPNNIAQFLPMVGQMVSDSNNPTKNPSGNPYIVSDSWGLCEAALTPSFLSAENTQLEVAAAAGLSFYVASGDAGSSACAAIDKRFTQLVSDDPSSQPFATGVGGTNLPHATPAGDSSVWKFGGGGISMLWPQPAYQSGNPHRSYDNGSKCGNNPGTGLGFCRQVPDIALDANPNTGYIIKCTVVPSGCPRGVPWFPIGGTSASAPLMAAITADANEYSLGHGGDNMGFANPFLYDSGTTTDFHDIVNGKNSITGGSLYAAQTGYDPASGLGAPQANALALDLAAYSAPSISQDDSQLTITAPLGNRTIHFGTKLTFSGTLVDHSAADAPIANRRVYIQLDEGSRGTWIYQTQTNVSGTWTFHLQKQLNHNLSWRVVFPGSDVETGVNVAGHHVYVIPKLGASSSNSSAHRGSSFTFKGSSVPNMRGAKVTLQVRRSAGGSWKTIANVTVNRRGGYSRNVSFATPGPAFLRWHYNGGKSKGWMSATSVVKRVSIT
jgi:kumamolisin